MLSDINIINTDAARNVHFLMSVALILLTLCSLHQKQEEEKVDNNFFELYVSFYFHLYFHL
jgi:hypothetical protein